MTFVELALLTSLLLGACSWASNVWPGDATWTRAAFGRLLLWGGPFSLIVWINDAPPGNALWLGAAAWIGSWIPHTDFPDVGGHAPTLLIDVAVVLLRVAAMLAPPTAVFWLCGAYWPAMLFAVATALPCLYAATRLPQRKWIGLQDERQVSGVLFGLAVGFWLAVAVWTPTPAPDLLP